MNGLPRHPGTEELAEVRTGVTDGARGDQVVAHLAECPECSSVSERLGRLPAVLASIPVPAVPPDIEVRIMNAIAAEADRRATDWDNRGPRRPVLPLRRPQSLTATVGVMAAAAACLVLGFIGFRLSDQGHPAAAPAYHGGPARTGGSPVVGNTAAGGITVPREDTTSPAFRQQGRSFPVLVSTANFRGATLRAQVTQQLTAIGQARAGRAPGNRSRSGPAGNAGPAAGLRVSPSKSLVGCVTLLDGGAEPTLVEEASYQSQPAYVIAIPTRAWVVARDCTPARLAVLASVALSPAR